MSTDIDDPPLPPHLQLEVTSACNLRCVMCLVRYRPPVNKLAGAMRPDLFHRLLAEVPALSRMTLQGLGEPLLSPYLMEMVRAAVARGITVGFNTNATLLTRDRAEEGPRAVPPRGSGWCSWRCGTTSPNCRTWCGCWPASGWTSCTCRTSRTTSPTPTPPAGTMASGSSPRTRHCGPGRTRTAPRPPSTRRTRRHGSTGCDCACRAPASRPTPDHPRAEAVPGPGRRPTSPAPAWCSRAAW